MCICQSRCLFVFDVCMYMYIFEYVFKLSHLLSANILPFRTCLYINIYKYRYLNIFANGRFIFICWLLFNIDLDFDLLLYFLWPKFYFVFVNWSLLRIFPSEIFSLLSIEIFQKLKKQYTSNIEKLK